MTLPIELTELLNQSLIHTIFRFQSVKLLSMYGGGIKPNRQLQAAEQEMSSYRMQLP